MKHALIVSALLFAGTAAYAGDYRVQLSSDTDLETTNKRLVEALDAKGMKVFASVDHAAGAKTVDAELAGNRVIIFGHPKVGTALMQCDPRIGIDLPMRMQLSEDEAGAVTIAYWSPKAFAEHYDMSKCSAVLDKVEMALGAFAEAAAGAAAEK